MSNFLVMNRHNIMSEAIQTIQNTVNKQLVDKVLAIEALKLGISGVKTDFNRLIESIDLLVKYYRVQ